MLKTGLSRICGRQPSKNLKGYGKSFQFKLFDGFLPQILLGPLFNIWTQIFKIYGPGIVID